ncbi:MAG: PAS domain-containing protein [Hyphomicrobiaceae bacterium]
MKQPTSRLLYGYWNEVRGDRIAPTRFEIEPSRISEILSEAFILELGERGGHVFRLAGSRICEQIGIELRGRDVRWLAGRDDSILDDMLEKITRDGGVGVLEVDAETRDGRHADFEMIILPLIHPAEKITRFVGAISFVDPPAWIGIEALTPVAIKSYEVIWPEGRPFSIVAHGRQQLALSPVFAGASVVRSERRQFRVLEGGRKP